MLSFFACRVFFLGQVNYIHGHRGLSSHVQESTNAIINWATENKMMINAKKTKDMWICFGQSSSEPPPVSVGDIELERVKTFKLLGVFNFSNLFFYNQTRQQTRKVYRLPEKSFNEFVAILNTNTLVTRHQISLHPALYPRDKVNETIPHPQD